MTIEELIKAATFKLGSKKMLAEKIGVSTRIISIWLHGKTKPRIYNMEAIRKIVE